MTGALSEVEQMQQTLLGALPGFCYTCDRQLVFTSSQGAGLKELGLEPGQIVGVSLFDIWETKDPSYAPYVHHSRALAGEAQTYQDVCLGRSLQYHLTPLRDAQGQVVGIVGMALDVTERENARREREQLLAQLRQAQRMESVGRLAGGIAHDFNNFLTCMMGNLSLIEGITPEVSGLDSCLSDMNAAIDKAAGLTRQLLAFSRKQVIDPQPLHLGKLVSHVDALLGRVLGARIALRSSCSRELWTVLADTGQMEQIVVNLVVNAKDAIEGSGEIVVSAENLEFNSEDSLSKEHVELKPGQYVMLTVQDTGSGMSDLVKERLFEPFFTTKEQANGTGLGLAMVYGAVQQNGGYIFVESQLGEGSTFRIYLPRIHQEIRVEEVPTLLRMSTHGGNETLLLVEDQPAVLELAQVTLQNLGYNVIPCADPDQALLKFDEYRNRIDLLIADIAMPRINGKELASRLCALQPGLPVLYCSGYGENIVAKEGVLEEGIHFIAKPYRPAELGREVRRVLDLKRKVPTAASTDALTDHFN